MNSFSFQQLHELVVSLLFPIFRYSDEVTEAQSLGASESYCWAQYLFPTCFAACCTAKSLQSCPTLWDPINGSPPGSPIPGILQARTLEWVAIFFSNAWKWKVKVKSLSHIWLVVTPWTAAYQAPPSMGFSRQEYWSRVPLPSPASHNNDWRKEWKRIKS